MNIIVLDLPKASHNKTNKNIVLVLVHAQMQSWRKERHGQLDCHQQWLQGIFQSSQKMRLCSWEINVMACMVKFWCLFWFLLFLFSLFCLLLSLVLNAVLAEILSRAPARGFRHLLLFRFSRRGNFLLLSHGWGHLMPAAARECQLQTSNEIIIRKFPLHNSNRVLFCDSRDV